MSDLKEAALREEVRAFLEKFPKRGGPVMARAIFDAKDGKNKMLNLIRAQRNADAENISAQNYYETQMEVGDGQSIKIRVYNAEPERPKTALIYLHGGGWTIGSAQTCAKVSSDFAYCLFLLVNIGLGTILRENNPVIWEILLHTCYPFFYVANLASIPTEIMIDTLNISVQVRLLIYHRISIDGSSKTIRIFRFGQVIQFGGQ